MRVIKRNGLFQDLDIKKIQDMCDWACENTNCSSEELQTEMKLQFKDKITTDQIHKIAIQTAIQKISYENPQWRVVAGRLKEIENRKLKSIESQGYLNMHDTKVDIFKVLEFNEYEIKYFPTAVKNPEEFQKIFEETIDLDKSYEYFIESIISLESMCGRYETIQHRYFLIATILAEKKLNGDYKEKIQEYYKALKERKIYLPSVIGKKLGKKEPNLISCFVGQMPDNLEQITSHFKDITMTTKAGGGWGYNLDKIRSRGSTLQGVQNRATGVVPLMKVLNAMMNYIDQAQANKLGVMTVSLSVWHKDIVEFLLSRQIGGEDRNKAMDLYHQIVVNDVFMEFALKDDDWYMFDPKEIKDKYSIELDELIEEEFKKTYLFLIEESKKNRVSCKKIPVKELILEIIKTLLNSSLPYITFKDTANRYNPLKEIGTIKAYNLCMESSSNITTEETHSCILTSLVLPFIKDEELEYTTKLAIEILNILKEITLLPNGRSKKHLDNYNNIGLGTFGLNDWLVEKFYTYELNQVEIEELYAKIAYYAVEKSSEIGQIKGNFKKFDESEYPKGKVLGREIEDFTTCKGELDWRKLREKTKKHMANGQLMANAPGTSASLSLGVTANLLPTHSKIFNEKTKYGDIPRLPLHIEKYPLGYKEYKHISHFKMNDCISRVSKYFDSSIAYELVFDLNKEEHRDINYIWEVIKDVWVKNIKTIYYIRWIKPSADTENEVSECVSCGS